MREERGGYEQPVGRHTGCRARRHRRGCRPAALCGVSKHPSYAGAPADGKGGLARGADGADSGLPNTSFSLVELNTPVTSSPAQQVFPGGVEMSHIVSEQRQREQQAKARAALGTMLVEPYRLLHAASETDATVEGGATIVELSGSDAQGCASRCSRLVSHTLKLTNTDPTPLDT